MEKVGVYCRLSDEDRYKKNKNDDSESIANQKSMLLKYALERNWEVVDIYSDDDLKDSLRLNYSFAYPAISYLPEKERITRQGAHDAIRNTSLGASPFQITPFKMAEISPNMWVIIIKLKLA